MSDKLPVLPPEWIESATAAAQNLGYKGKLADLSSEQWQRVLANVSARMTMKEIDEPEGWRDALTFQAARVVERDGRKS